MIVQDIVNSIKNPDLLRTAVNDVVSSSKTWARVSPQTNTGKFLHIISALFAVIGWPVVVIATSYANIKLKETSKSQQFPDRMEDVLNKLRNLDSAQTSFSIDFEDAGIQVRLNFSEKDDIRQEKAGQPARPDTKKIVITAVINGEQGQIGEINDMGFDDLQQSLSISLRNESITGQLPLLPQVSVALDREGHDELTRDLSALGVDVDLNYFAPDPARSPLVKTS